MRLLITGSREWTDIDRLYKALDSLHTKGELLVPVLPLPPPGWLTRLDEDWTLVSGHCPAGVDRMGEAWARSRGVLVEEHPADWRPDGGAYRPQAGIIRNAEMVALGADICMAFATPCVKLSCRKPKPHGSHGTMHCAGAAFSAGIPTATHREGW